MQHFLFLSATKMLCEWFSPSVCLSARPSVRLSRIFALCSHHRIIMKLILTESVSMQKVKVRDHRSRSQRGNPNLAFLGPYLSFEFTFGNDMMHKVWCGKGETPYHFSRSSAIFQCHTGHKIANFVTRSGRFWTVTPCFIHWWLWNDAWNSIREVPIVFEDHPSNLKVTHEKYCWFSPKFSVSRL